MHTRAKETLSLLLSCPEKRGANEKLDAGYRSVPRENGYLSDPKLSKVLPP